MSSITTNGSNKMNVFNHSSIIHLITLKLHKRHMLPNSYVYNLFNNTYIHTYTYIPTYYLHIYLIIKYLGTHIQTMYLLSYLLGTYIPTSYLLGYLNNYLEVI
jgi:hypothetical protein